jgi:hypothetical protein
MFLSIKNIYFIAKRNKCSTFAGNFNSMKHHVNRSFLAVFATHVSYFT